MFPFSSSPLLLQESILKKLSPFDMFCFSLISRKSHHLAKRSKLIVKQFQWKVKEDSKHISITGTDGEDYDVVISSKEESSELPTFDAQIDDINFSVYASHTFYWPRERRIVSENVEVFAKVISGRLMEVLRPQKFSLGIEDCSIPPYIFRFTRTFKNVLAYFSPRSLHNDAALALFNEITADYLYLNYSSFEVSEHLSLNHRKIELNKAHWFTKELLMKTDCQELILEAPNLTSEDLQEFFERWKNGKFPKLKEFCIRMVGRQWNLILEYADGKGFRVITDVEGNVGKIKHIGYILTFRVNDHR